MITKVPRETLYVNTHSQRDVQQHNVPRETIDYQWFQRFNSRNTSP
jgi:hypothetical protein